MSDTPKRRAPDKATDTRTRSFDSTGPADPNDERTRTSVPGGEPARTEALPRFDGYAVVRKIGEGGMGSVYLAEDVQLGRAVAIKTMRPEVADARNRERFVREAQTAAAVEHDNIVPILHIGDAADGTPFIVMPFLKGEMLADRLKREPRAPADLILTVAREVAEGLAAAHAKGLIHRDIKPGNVWLEAKGKGIGVRGEGVESAASLPYPLSPLPSLRCKILDFGLARSTESGDVNLTATGAVLGTPAYMAPEQARGERVDGRADLWSLGVMLYRMAAGQLPFRGENGMAILIALATETPPPTASVRPDLPPPLAALTDWLLQKRPADRPRSAADVAAAVRAIQDGMPVALPQPAVVAAPSADPWEEATATDEGDDNRPDADAREAAPRAEPARARWWLVGGALVGLLALVAAAALALRPAEAALAVEVAPGAEGKFRAAVVFGPDGAERFRLTANERSRTLPPGAYTVRADGPGLTVEPSAVAVRRGDRVTVRVGVAPPQPAVPVPVIPPKVEPKLDFREIHGATEAELDTWMQKLQADGYRPAALNADAAPEARFAAVAAPNVPKLPWTFVPRQETTGPRWQGDWEGRWNAGLKPDVCALYFDAGNQYASQVWVTDTRLGGSWTGPRAFVQGKIAELRAPGSRYRPTELAGSSSRFGLRYQVVMGPTDGRPWEAQFDLTAEQLADAVASWRKQGWRPEAVSGYRDGDRLRFVAVFAEDPTRGAGWEFQMGLSAKEYGEKVAARTVRPLVVLGYVPAGAGPTLYAVVWQKTAAVPK